MVNAFRWMVFVIGLAVVIGSIMVTSASDPILFIDSPTDGESVDYDTITVSGRAMGTDYAVLESVMVNDVLATGTILWHAEISLHTGSNLITVVAKDDLGQSSSETITVICNPPTPPIQPPRYDGAPSAIPTPTPTPTGSISVTTSPPGAEVDLDGSFAGNTTITLTLKDVTIGYHKVKVSKEGYRSETRKICLYTGKTSELNIELKPITGSIYISSTPSGASVYLDDDDMKAITPYVLREVLIGQHSIKLTKSDYFDVTRNVSVSVGRTSNLHENLTGYGSIDISSDPSGAKVYLDDVFTNDTPSMLSEVVVGPHTIKLTKFGYDDEIRIVSLSVGETLYLSENITGYGSLCISSNPSGASVYLDGVYKGKTLLDIPKVVVGSYSIGLTKSGYGKVEKPIHVSAGETTYVHVPFSGGIPPNYELLVIILAIISSAVLTIIIPFIVMRYKNRPPQGPD